MSRYCDRCGGEIIFRYIDGRPVPIHLSGGCYGWSSQNNNTKSPQSDTKNTQEKIDTLNRSFTIPNALCPECGEEVYYYENEHGSRVFFDELGPPWPKHPCTDSKSTNEETNFVDHNSRWTKFYIKKIKEKKVGDYFHTYWQGDYVTKNSKLNAGFGVNTLQTEAYKEIVIEKLIYIKPISQTDYEISFYTTGTDFNEITINAYTRKKFKNKFSEIFKKKSKNLKKSKKKKKGGVKENKLHEKKILPSYSGHLKPQERLISCPICKHHFLKKEHLRQHIEDHWERIRRKPGSIFNKIDKEKWKQIILNELE